MYTVDYETDKKIINVIIDGRINYSIAEKYSKDALKLAREYKCTKFLINHCATTITKTSNIHASGADLQQFGFKSSDKIAVVILSAKGNHFFVEADNGNTEWSTIKYFYSGNTDKAISWLLDK